MYRICLRGKVTTASVHLQFYIRNAAPSDSGSGAAALTRENYLTTPALHGHVSPC